MHSATARIFQIGVNTGSSLIPKKARRKWGVDPSYTISSRLLAKFTVFSSLGIRVEKLFHLRVTISF
jgi:hypothetical protein